PFLSCHKFNKHWLLHQQLLQAHLSQAEREDFINKLDENIQKIIKEQVKVQVSKILPKIEKTVNEQLEAKVLTRSSNSSKISYVVAADLSEMELKKILLEKMEINKSIHRSNEQRNLYKALIILDTYGDIVTLKRHHDDANKDEKPSIGSDRGSKRRRKGKEPESTSTSKEKASKTVGKSTKGSKSHQKTASESAPAEEPMQTTQDLEEPSHKKFETDTLTPELSAGPTYELMKGSCKILMELKFFLEEVYKETTDQLDWNNPEGQQYPHNLLKPLPLIPKSRGRRIIPFDHFINNDLEYLRGGASSRKVKRRSAMINMLYGESLIKGANVNSSIDLRLTGSLLEMSTQNVESSLLLNFRLSNGTTTSTWIELL
nr:hypothetical protein [Tanacetum cinerariifolium]